MRSASKPLRRLSTSADEGRCDGSTLRHASARACNAAMQCNSRAMNGQAPGCALQCQTCSSGGPPLTATTLHRFASQHLHKLISMTVKIIVWRSHVPSAVGVQPAFDPPSDPSPPAKRTLVPAWQLSGNTSCAFSDPTFTRIWWWFRPCQGRRLVSICHRITPRLHSKARHTAVQVTGQCTPLIATQHTPPALIREAARLGSWDRDAAHRVPHAGLLTCTHPPPY